MSGNVKEFFVFFVSLDLRGGYLSPVLSSLDVRTGFPSQWIPSLFKNLSIRAL